MTTPAGLAAPTGAVPSHESAALILGLRVLDEPASATVTVAHARSRVRAPGCEVFRASLPDADVWTLGDGSLTSPMRTVCDLARHRSFEAAVVTLDSALQVNLVLPRNVEATLSGLARGGRGAARVRRVLLAGDGRSQSVPESVARVWLQGDPRVGRVVPQLSISPGGHCYDLGLPDLRKLVEYQSWEFHGERTVWVKDARWGNEAVARGWGYVQLVDADIRRGAAHVVDVALGLSGA